MAVPGHTLGHIAYFVELSNDDPSSFVGHPILGGCGRLFEGTPHKCISHLTRFAALPGQTRVCCAHEYTLSNLKFARAVEPENEDLMRYSVWCEERRAALEPTLPSRVEIERQINPFLRVTQSAVVAAAQSKSPASPPDPSRYWVCCASGKITVKPCPSRPIAEPCHLCVLRNSVVFLCH